MNTQYNTLLYKILINTQMSQQYLAYKKTNALLYKQE